MFEIEVRQRFRDFALELGIESAGPVLGVFGASGSGKTTLLHAVAGLLRPERAHIAVGGRTLSKLDPSSSPSA
jgi:molybdate transport system ATP-binding protein